MIVVVNESVTVDTIMSTCVPPGITHVNDVSGTNENTWLNLSACKASGALSFRYA